MISDHAITRPSRLSAALSILLAGAYAVYIALCMFSPHIMSARNEAVFGASTAIIAGVALLTICIIASVLYLVLSRRNDDQGARR